MIIECHSCHARFRLDEGKIRGKAARVKCRRCGNGIIVLRDRPAAAEAPPPDNLIPFPFAARAAEPPGREPGAPSRPASTGRGEAVPFSPGPHGGKDEVDLAFERLLAGAPGPEPPDAVQPPAVAEIPEAEEPARAPAGDVPAPPEATEPAASRIPPAEPSEAPSLEFGPEETLELPHLPPEEPAPEGAAPAFRGEGGLLLSDADTLAFLKEEHRTAGSPPDSDISLSLSEAPIDLEAPSLRKAPPSGEFPAVPPEPAAPAPASAAAGEIAIEGNETPPPERGEVDGTPSPDVPPQPPRIEARVPAGVTPATPRPAGPPVRIAWAVLGALALAAAGYLGFTSPGRKTVERLAPGIGALWGGKPAEKGGSRYEVKNVIGYYETAADGKRLLVIKGQVANLSAKERSGIRVVAAILDGEGKPLAEHSVYAGNVLPGETVRKMDRQAAEKVFANRFGSGLVNMNVGPGKSIPFMVVFFDAPESIDSYRLEARDAE